jgi:hypothetical protein
MYAPSPYQGGSLEQYVQDELMKLAQALDDKVNTIRFSESAVNLPKPRDGDVGFYTTDPSDAHSGKGLYLRTGSKWGKVVTGTMNSAVLVAGTKAVSLTSITANAKIFLNRSTTGGTVGHLSYTISAGVGFTINSSSATDTSTVVYIVVEP